jgi:ribosomal protein S18 acetylase RimI-like enzyme
MMGVVDGDIDGRIQAYLRATAARGREVVRVADFTALFHPDDSLKYLNYAIPEPGAASVEGLAEPFVTRGRLPRVEYVESCAPALGSTLEEAGFSLEARLVLMTCTPERHVAIGGAALEDVPADAPRGVVRELITAQRRAFADAGEPTERDVDRYREISGDGLGILARVDGEPAGGGQLTKPADGLTELVGIGVLPPFRRRGIGAAITSALAAAAFGRGVEIAFLTPGDENTQRIYERAGFGATSTMLNYSLNATDLQ